MRLLLRRIVRGMGGAENKQSIRSQDVLTGATCLSSIDCRAAIHEKVLPQDIGGNLAGQGAGVSVP
jgi:hypothetical protein